MFFWDSKPKPRYKIQLDKVEHLVVDEINMSRDELFDLLEVLHEYEVID